MHSWPRLKMALMLLTPMLVVNACDRAPELDVEIADEVFADLLVEVLVLQERHVGQPDSLSHYRAALLDSAGITDQQIRGYIESLQSRQEAWLPLLDRVEARLDSIKRARQDTSLSTLADSLSSPKPVEAVRYRAE